MNGRLVRGLLIALICSAVALLTVFKLSGSRIAWSDLREVNPIVIIAVPALVSTGWICDSLRILLLAQIMGVHIGFWSGLRISITGQFVLSLMPFGAGSEPVQVYLLTNEGLSVGEASAAIAMKTLCNAAARLALALISLAWMALSGIEWRVPAEMKAAMLTGLTLYIGVFCFSVLLMADPSRIETMIAPLLRSRIALRLLKRRGATRMLNSISRVIAEFQGSLRRYRRREMRTLLAVMLLGVAVWIGVSFVPVVILRGLGVQAPVGQVMGSTMLFHMASSYVPTPGASGFAELGFADLLRMIVPPGLLGLAVTVWRLLTYYFTLLAGGALVVGQMLRGRLTDPA